MADFCAPGPLVRLADLVTAEAARIRAALPVGSVLVGSPLSRRNLPVRRPRLTPIAALLLDVADDVNGRCCFNCAAPVAFTRARPGADDAMSLDWAPFVVLAAEDGGLTVVCVSCAAPF